MSELLGFDTLFNRAEFLGLLIRLVINFVFALVAIATYTRQHGDDRYRFTYFLFNIITFCLCFMLRKVPVELGFALSLFAVFGILRYRTEPIGIRNLTYLFVVIGIAVVNAVANGAVSLAELLLVNVAIVGALVVLEWSPIRGRRRYREVVYDDLPLLTGADSEALLRDLSKRTGLNVQTVDVLRYDLLRDTAMIRICYRVAGPAS